MLSTSEYPNAGAEYSLLADALVTEALPKYSLSQKACEGILRRINKREKILPIQMQQALQIVAQPQP